MRGIMAVILGLSLCVAGRAAEEKIRGVLEKTTKAGACAQITDALAEIYYISKTDESEKAIAEYVGKNVKVVISGTVEAKEGDPSYFFALKTVEKYAPKLPPAPEKKAEAKPPENKPAPTLPPDPTAIPMPKMEVKK